MYRIKRQTKDEPLRQKALRVGIIGAGMAGLSCARRLAAAGIESTILDKGRGVGGRLATRITHNGLQFDHGAQYATARDPSFLSLLNEMEDAGRCGRWTVDGKQRLVGTPGMSGLTKHLARGLDIRQRTEVARIGRAAGSWNVWVDGHAMRFERLVITIPAPQAAALLGQAHELTQDINRVRMTPCLTLMAAFASDAPAPFITRRDPDDAIAWMALDSSKPGRRTAGCWVAQAGPGWSAERLELEPVEIAEQMLDLLCDRIDLSPSSAVHAVAHRWRYANVAEALGAPFLRNGESSLYVGGDWCVKGRIEAAWQSGAAIADDLLDNL